MQHATGILLARLDFILLVVIECPKRIITSNSFKTVPNDTDSVYFWKTKKLLSLPTYHISNIIMYLAFFYLDDLSSWLMIRM